MPAKITLPSHLKFLNKKPDEKHYKLSKQEAYFYLEKLVLTKGTLGKTKDHLPGYITHLQTCDDLIR